MPKWEEKSVTNAVERKVRPPRVVPQENREKWAQTRGFRGNRIPPPWRSSPIIRSRSSCHAAVFKFLPRSSLRARYKLPKTGVVTKDTLPKTSRTINIVNLSFCHTKRSGWTAATVIARERFLSSNSNPFGTRLWSSLKRNSNNKTVDAYHFLAAMTVGSDGIWTRVWAKN